MLTQRPPSDPSSLGEDWSAFSEGPARFGQQAPFGLNNNPPPPPPPPLPSLSLDIQRSPRAQHKSGSGRTPGHGRKMIISPANNSPRTTTTAGDTPSIIDTITQSPHVYDALRKSPRAYILQKRVSPRIYGSMLSTQPPLHNGQGQENCDGVTTSMEVDSKPSSAEFFTFGPPPVERKGSLLSLKLAMDSSETSSNDEKYERQLCGNLSLQGKALLAYIDTLSEGPNYEVHLRQQKVQKSTPSTVQGYPCSITSPQLQALEPDASMMSVFQGGFRLDDNVESPEHAHAHKLAGIRKCFEDEKGSSNALSLSGGVTTGRRGEPGLPRTLQVSPAVEAERKIAAEASKDELQALINAKLQLNFTTAAQPTSSKQSKNANNPQPSRSRKSHRRAKKSPQKSQSSWKAVNKKEKQAALRVGQKNHSVQVHPSRNRMQAHSHVQFSTGFPQKAV